MCTAATYQMKDFYFGRTLDYEFSYGDELVITPRRYVFAFRHRDRLASHYAMIGIAHVAEGYPLYYDGVNEKGLGIAGLNFTGNAVYEESGGSGENIAQFELIPWILGQCVTVQDACALLRKSRIVNTTFSDHMPVAQLHWLIADKEEAVTVESVAEGLKIYPNPVDVLTNNPPFPEQMFQLNNYRKLSPKQPANLFSEKLSLQLYSQGMGALGLPGDLSSSSRFVRAAYVRLNSVSGDSEEKSVSQFFHILGAVDQQRGCCEVAAGEYKITLYTSCCNADKGIYYYTTYDNHQISAVNMHRENLDGTQIVQYPVVRKEQIYWQN